MAKKPTYQELKQKIEELEKESEKYKKKDVEYRTIFNNSTDLIFTLNKDNCVISANPQAVRFLNKQTEDVVGKSIHQLFPEDRGLHRVMVR